MSGITSKSNTEQRPFPALTIIPPKPLAPHEPLPITEQSRANADYDLAMEYQGVLQKGNWQRDDKISDIPPGSAFYKWWMQLLGTFQSPDVRQWIEDQGIDRSSIKLNLVSGQITFALKRALDPKQTLHTLGQDDPQWAAISGPVFAAANVIAGHADTAFTPPTGQFIEPVAWQVIGRFYQERLDLPADKMRQRATQIRSGKGFEVSNRNSCSRLSTRCWATHTIVIRRLRAC